LQQTLQKQKRTTNIFRFLNFETRTEGNSKQSKICLDFSNTKLKIRNEANQSYKTKEENKEKQQKYFWFFVFWKVEIRKRTTKKRKRNMDIQSTDKI
jgi:hypothetical protein